eukprot:1195772-Prorocentrum_minimum.AAC.1
MGIFSLPFRDWCPRWVYLRSDDDGVPCFAPLRPVPFYVATKLAKMRKSLMVPSPDGYAKLGCGWIAQGDAVVQPFWMHAVQGWVLDCMPAWFVNRMVKNMHVGIMKRGMKKEAAAAKQQ